MNHGRIGRIPFSLTGTGNQVKETGIVSGAAKRNMRVVRFNVRQDTGGGATAANFYFIDHNRSTVTVPANTPREDVPIEMAAVPLTASATALSLDTPVDAIFQDSLNLVADVTAVGAWSLVGYIDFEA